MKKPSQEMHIRCKERGDPAFSVREADEGRGFGEYPREGLHSLSIQTGSTLCSRLDLFIFCVEQKVKCPMSPLSHNTNATLHWLRHVVIPRPCRCFAFLASGHCSCKVDYSRSVIFVCQPVGSVRTQAKQWLCADLAEQGRVWSLCFCSALNSKANK